MTGVFSEEEIRSQIHTEGRICEEDGHQQAKEEASEDLRLSSLQNCGKIHFCGFKLPVSGDLPWQP